MPAFTALQISELHQECILTRAIFDLVLSRTYKLSYLIRFHIYWWLYSFSKPHFLNPMDMGYKSLLQLITEQKLETTILIWCSWYLCRQFAFVVVVVVLLVFFFVCLLFIWFPLKYFWLFSNDSLYINFWPSEHKFKQSK